MRYPFLALLESLAVVMAIVSLVPVPVAGQARSAEAKAKTWTPTRTPDGRPDLQGIWNFSTITPLERPGDLAGKAVLTDEEAVQLEEQTAATRRATDRAPTGPTTNVGTYNQFWYDAGTKVVGDKRTSLIVDPPDGRLPPFTPRAEKDAAVRAEVRRRPATGPEDRSVGERCIMGFNAGPPMLPVNYNNFFQLFQSREHVVIFNEMNHNARIIPMDGRPPLTIRQWSGDSRGRWEGNTLVVETRNFGAGITDKGTGLINARVATDENLHLVERFTRVSADALLYEFTVSDPTVWTRPWTAAIPVKKADEGIYEYACHEGNYGLRYMLEAARAAEKSAEAAAKKSSK